MSVILSETEIRNQRAARTAAIVNRFTAGEKVAAIAADLDVCEGTVYRALKRAKITPPGRDLDAEHGEPKQRAIRILNKRHQWSNRAIAAALGLTEVEVARRVADLR